MSAQEFSVGEWVERQMDGKVGVVKKVEPYRDTHVYYVNFPDDWTDETWAGFTSAWRRHHRVHAHSTTSSRDCDGSYSGGHIVRMSLLERCERYGDLQFRDRVTASVISLHGHGTLEVTPEGLEWHERTEEGFRSEDIVWCDEECPDESPWRRDHRAEAMGY